MRKAQNLEAKGLGLHLNFVPNYLYIPGQVTHLLSILGTKQM